MIVDDDYLLRAIAEQRYAHAIVLVEAGADLNEPIDDGASPLFAAILSGHMPLIEAMLRRGANPSFRAQEPANAIYADTPLDLAMQARVLVDWATFHPVVKLLRYHAARDVDDSNSEVANLAEIEMSAKAWQSQCGPADQGG